MLFCRADWNKGGPDCTPATRYDANGPKDVEGNVGAALVKFQADCSLSYKEMWAVLEDHPALIHSYAEFVFYAPSKCTTPTAAVPPTTVPTPIVPTPTTPTTGVCVSQPTLQRGAQGDSVRELQSILGGSVVVDGDFGPATETAVISFQSANGLEADGLVGPITWAALCNGGTPAAPTPASLPTVPTPAAPTTGVCVSKPTLQQGAHGDSVSELQSILNSKGGSVVVDGDFGPATNNAVTTFQSANGLEVDGIVGPITWAALCNGGNNIPSNII